MARHYVQMLDAVVRDPGCAAGRVEMLSAPERHQLLYGWNDTGAAFPADKCVHDEISRQAMSTPDRVAVAFGAIELSYEQLVQRSNQVARYLRKLGVGPDVRVGVCLDRSGELVVFLLGILKAGGAYGPLDPGYPADRLQYMAQDAQAPVGIVQKRQVQLLANPGVRLSCGEDRQGGIEAERWAGRARTL